jgi:hypothetical protein
LNAGAVRRLEKPRVRGRYEVPPKRVEVGGEDVRRVETLAGEVAPVGWLENMRIDLSFPEDRKALALRVILQARKVNERLFPKRFLSRFDGFHQIAAAPNPYDLAG